MGRHRFWVLLMLVAAAAGCEDEVKDCLTGEEVICSCAKGGNGTKTCQVGGVWSACKGCAGSPDSGLDGAGGDGPVGDAADNDGAQQDGAQADGKPDSKQGDTGPADVTITDAPLGPSPWHQVPMSKNDTLYAVWGSGPTDIYAVGSKGTVVRFNGRKPALLDWFKSMSTGVSTTLHGVWGSGPRDVFAVGEGGNVLHNDGLGWKTQTAGTTSSFRSIWGTGFSNVFALGEFGTAMNNGRTTSPNTWTTVKSGSKATFLGAWGTGSKAFFVVGSGGTILRNDGTTWKTMSSGTTNHLWGVWAASASKAFAVGEKGTIVAWDGTAWKTQASGTTDTLFGVWGSAANNVFAVGDNGVVLRFNGSSWAKMNSGTKNGLRGVWGSGPNNVFAVGENMTIINYGPCNCKVGKLCYATGERDDTGCKACVPSTSSTSLTAVSAACTISTVCYAQGEKDSTMCKVCDPTKSKTSWSTVGGVCSIGGQCWPSGHNGATHCQQCLPTKSSTAWTMVGNKCLISGKCLASGSKDSTGCKVCDPTKSTTGWTVVPNKCNIAGTCYANGQKDLSGCRLCDAKKNPSGWTEIAGKCFISGKCYNNGVGDGSGCRTCDTTKNTKAWTVKKGKCYIEAKCYGQGYKPPATTCRVCDTAKSTTAWTLMKNTCYIGSTCYGNGAKHSSGCQGCDVTKSTTAWTMYAGKCLIGSQCINSGTKDATGCQVCNPAKSTIGWTMLGCPATLPKHQVTFAHGTSTSSMTMATINSDGTGYKKLPGFGTVYLSYSSYLYGRVKQYYPFTRNVPQQLTNQPYYPISLPNGIGRIKYFRDYNGGLYTVGALLIRPDGTVEVLHKSPGSSTSYFYYYFSVSDDGKWVASHSASLKQIILMRTDKKKFKNGQSSLALSMLPAPYYIYPTSITLTNKFIYVITRSGSSYSSKHDLWRAPVDGSGALKKISLPMVNGVIPYWIDDEIAFSGDGNTAIITAGNYYSSSYSKTEDVISIDATGKAVNVTKAPSNYEERGYNWGYYSYGCQLAVSPTGKQVAYIKYLSSSSYELYVAKTDGTGTKHHVTSPVNFSSSYKRVFNLRWIDDDNLIFSAYGSSSSYNDIFRYQVSKATVTNLTKNGKATKPFTLCCGYTYFYGMWLSPNKKWLYYLARKQGSPYYTTDILAIDLTTWKKKSITSGAEVYQSADGFAACDKKPIMFFAAEPKAVNYTQEQLFMFDMNAGTKAVQLTNIKKSPSSSTYWYLYDINPSANCGAVSFRSGYSSYWDAHAVRLSPPPPAASNVTEVTTSTGYSYVYDLMGISGDNSQLIYFQGSASNKYDMKRALTLGKCCKPKTIYTASGTYKYWYLFGVK